MRTILRRVIVLMLSLSLAAASGYAPRHAKASVFAPDLHQSQEFRSPDHAAAPSTHSQTPSHRHGHDCDEPAKKSHGPVSTDQNCCVTSCAAMATVSALIDFRHDLPKARFELPLSFGLALLALASIEPPPR